MIKTMLMSAALLLLADAAFAANAPAPSGSVTIELPGDAGASFKPGPGVENAQRYCLTCHSSAYVSTQPVLSEAQWTAEVTKMRKVYAAPIPDDQVASIVSYLTATYGKP